MKAIFTIARRDILGYLSAPKAAAIFWFFLIIMGFFFWSLIYSFIEYQQKAAQMGGSAPALEEFLRALFYNLHFVLLLIVPAVTMSSFAEERRTQTIRFLLSAPLKPFQIVLGKYLALIGLMSIVLIGSFVYPVFTLYYGTPDAGPILTSYLGLFLLLCAQLAFGLFVSSMTTNQFLAFLFTMLGVFLLLILNWLSPSLSKGGTAGGVLKYLGSTTHIDQFFKGLITVSDVTYFLCFALIFLLFTMVSIDSLRWR